MTAKIDYSLRRKRQFALLEIKTPILREFFRILQGSGESIKAFTFRLGASKSSYYRWKTAYASPRHNTNSPGIFLVESAFNALGYSLVAIPTRWLDGEERSINDLEELEELRTRARQIEQSKVYQVAG